MRGTTYIGIYVLIGVVSAGWSHGQESSRPPTAESVTARLTGGGQREWVQTLWIPILGPAGCVQGELWTFNQDGKGVKKTCESGAVRERQFQWVWTGTQNDQVILKVNEQQYIVEFRQRLSKVEGAPPVPVMLLRTLRTSASTPVDEITLELPNR